MVVTMVMVGVDSGGGGDHTSIKVKRAWNPGKQSAWESA